MIFIIIDTKTVSGHGSEDTDNFTSTDKLYLLAPKEIYSDWSNQYDSAKDFTRQLDYYNSKSVTTSSYEAAIKNNSAGPAQHGWWLRSTASNGSFYFYSVTNRGGWGMIHAAYDESSVSPVFRIG